MPTALVTGIRGFTGRYLTQELLQAGYTVVGISPEPAQIASATVHPCDLTDRAQTARAVDNARPDLVVHLAGIAFVAHGDFEAMYRTHVIGTRNLLEALAGSSHKPASVLLASSAHVYGNAKLPVLDESTPLAPASDYAVSKVAMEYLARLWMDRLPINIVRPFNYTGVGQSQEFLLPKIVRHFKSRAPVIELGNLHVTRDFSDVRSVARWYRLLLETQTSGEVFNTCSERGYSLHEVLSIMRELSGYSPEVVINPAFVRSQEMERLVGSRAKLDRTVGAVSDIPLQETLAWMFSSGT